MNDYQKQLDDEILVKKWNVPIVQSGRILEKDCALFYKLYLGLLEYVNLKYKVVKAKFYRASMISPADQHQVRAKLFEDVSVIDEFIQVNPFKFNRRELEAVSKFKYAMLDHFIVLKYEKTYTVFKRECQEKDEYYAVKGLYSNLNEMLSEYDLPFFVETALIPFAGKIVADGILNVIPLHMSARMALRHIQGYDEDELLRQISSFNDFDA